MSLALLSGYGTDSEDETDEDKEKNSKGTVSVQPVQVEAPVILPSAEELAKLHSLASSSGMSGTASLLSSLYNSKQCPQPSSSRKRQWQGRSQDYTRDNILSSDPKKTNGGHYEGPGKVGGG
jgi:hypothetical protein